MRPMYALMATALMALPLSPALAQDAARRPEIQKDLERPTRHAAELDAGVRDRKFDLGRKNLAIEGYDPVTYWPEGGSEPDKGSKKITHTFRGVTYRFVSAANRDLFKADPDKYEPAFGGWCAYAMAKEEYTEPDPKRFTIHSGRLYLFYDGLFGDTYDDWFEEGPSTLDPLAIAFWNGELDEAAGG